MELYLDFAILGNGNTELRSIVYHCRAMLCRGLLLLQIRLLIFAERVTNLLEQFPPSRNGVVLVTLGNLSCLLAGRVPKGHVNEADHVV